MPAFVYVANGMSNSVSVISGRTGTVTATIPVGSEPIGVAVNPVTGTVYVTNADSNTVSVISGQTDTVTATIPWAANRSGSRLTGSPEPSTSPTSATEQCR